MSWIHLAIEEPSNREKDNVMNDRFRAKIRRHQRQTIPVQPARKIPPPVDVPKTPTPTPTPTIPKSPINPTRPQAKLAFTTCINEKFIPGAEGLILSIRRFHPTADIVVFCEEEYSEFKVFADLHAVSIQYFDHIKDWAFPLIYHDPLFQNNSNHFYHKDFKITPDMPRSDHHLNRITGFGIHHLHPMNVKAYCTGYCICVKNYDRVVHIDSDAFLLANIDTIFEKHQELDTVVCWEDGGDNTGHLEIFGIDKPPNYDQRDYGMNAGIVFYVNGPNLKEMIKEFMFFIDSCYHYTVASPNGDQGILRNIIAKHHILKRIHFYRYERTNWNPTWRLADDLVLEDGKWINNRNGQRQFIWHGAGAAKVWTGGYSAPGVNDAWKWLGGRYA